jgi:hypothetical protein
MIVTGGVIRVCDEAGNLIEAHASHPDAFEIFRELRLAVSVGGIEGEGH